MGLGGGSVRINVFPDASTRLPKLDLELFHFFGRVNMYINLVPRANLARLLPAHGRAPVACRPCGSTLINSGLLCHCKQAQATRSVLTSQCTR